MQDVLRVAVVASPKRLARALGPEEVAGVNLGPVRARLANVTHRDRSRQISQADLATPPGTWGTIDYATVQPEVLRGHVEWIVELDRVGHGLVVWSTQCSRLP